MSTPAEPTGTTSWQALGMLVQLVVTAPDRLSDARDLLDSDLADLDRTCSRFRPDSEVSRLGRAPAGESGLVTATVSPLLAEAVTVALRAASLTDGDVDPTVGRALSALGYDRDFGLLDGSGGPQGTPEGGMGGRAVPPSGVRKGGGTPPLGNTATLIPGWREISVDPAAHRVTLPAGVQLDLGATVKGWAADRSAARIAGKLGCGVLVSLGGDTAVAGTPPEGGWRIRVQDVTGAVDAAPDGPVTVIAIREGGLATSSTAARRWSRGGNVLHHILDPRTGMPAPPIWRTVSVAAASCADANTAATAAIIRGWQAPAWLTSLRLPSRLVETNGTVHCLAGWP